MNKFKVYDIADAPSNSREHLEKIKQDHGYIPNEYGVMAESPALLKSYLALTELFDKVTLTAQEQKIVLLTASQENGSEYCVDVHSRAAEKHKVPAEVIGAIHAGKPLKDKKLEALRAFTALAVNCRGKVSESAVADFLSSGYTRANILEVVLDISMATLTNYTNLVAKTLLDQQPEAKIWQTVH
jgi:AhpD family alkylhydroperoxidase